MPKAFQFIVGTLFFAALGFYGLLSSQPESPSHSSLVTTSSTSAPASADATDLAFTAEDGTHVDLARMRGKVVLLDFWATWCPPCRGEVPNVVAAYNTYHAQGFEVIGVSLDQDRDAMTQFTAENGMPWPQYFDGQGWNNALAQRFGVDSIPQMWLFDRQGRLVTKDGREDLAGQVASLLQQR